MLKALPADLSMIPTMPAAVIPLVSLRHEQVLQKMSPVSQQRYETKFLTVPPSEALSRSISTLDILLRFVGTWFDMCC